jgi:hypothetical protein
MHVPLDRGRSVAKRPRISEKNFRTSEIHIPIARRRASWCVSVGMLHLAGSLALQRYGSAPPPTMRATRISMMAQDLQLTGTAGSSLLVPKLDASSPLLGDFLLSPDSNEALLGTPDFRELDSIWECKQAPVEWFSVELTPVFREVIERPSGESCVNVKVLEASIEIAEGGKRSSLVSNAMGQVMSRASITGLNEVRWDLTASGDVMLSGDITLALTVAPPKLFPVPRKMFESVGSGIIRTTCKQRGDAFLKDLAKAYAEWAQKQPASR